MNTHKIPATDSIQELAEFWDTHDLTDFDAELEEVPGPVFQRPTGIDLQLQPDEVEAVNQIAAAKGLPYADLIRQWVRENIRSSGFCPGP